MSDLSEPTELTRKNDVAALAAKETATDRFDVMHEIVSKLSNDLHAMKSELAVNTVFTRDVMNQSDATKLALEELAAAVKTMQAGVGELISIFMTLKGFFTFMKWVGKFVQWAAIIVGPLIGVYFAWKKGGPNE